MPVELHRSHPNVHQPWAEWSEQEKLHVAVAYSNPFRWRTRRELADNCIRHLRSSPNVVLHVGELAYGDRPHEIVDPKTSPLDVALRTESELWHKENILNRVIETFPSDWKYGAYVDADWHFARPDWSLEGIHQLQHYDWVQLFSSYADLGGNTYGTAQIPTRVTAGFAFNYIQNGYQLPEGFANGGWKKAGGDVGYYGVMAGGKRGVGATGGAWAFTRKGFNMAGRLLDECALGHADWFMTFGLVGEEAPDMHINGYSEDYRSAIYEWQRNAARIKKNIGYVDGFAVHNFHGSKMRRAYSSRDTILVKHQFSPRRHMKRDYQGIYQLNVDEPGLRDDFRRYFVSRSEDDPNLYGDEKILI